MAAAAAGITNVFAVDVVEKVSLFSYRSFALSPNSLTSDDFSRAPIRSHRCSFVWTWERAAMEMHQSMPESDGATTTMQI